MSPIIVTIQVGKPRKLGVQGANDPMDRSWETGIFKEPVVGPVWLGKENLDGDGQADLKLHGGPERAVLAYPEEHYSFWREKLNIPELATGGLGENFVVSGITEKEVCIGDSFQVGEAVIQVSQPRQPCWKLARRWKVKELGLLAQTTGRTGWLCRVLKEGYVQQGDALTLLERPHPKWSVDQVNTIRYSRDFNIETVLELAGCPLLEVGWQKAFISKTKGVAENVEGRVLGKNRK